MLASQHLGFMVLIACATWWLSTGIILSLVARPQRTYRWSMLGGVLVGLTGLMGLIATRASETIEGALTAFASALAVWGCIEMAFLMGYVVGPSRQECPKGLSIWPRFKASWAALAHHEMALVAALGLLFVLLFGQPNQLGLQTFALLWAMRLSTKLNIFLGVSSAGEDFLPARVRYLGSYFASAPMNPLFPISITAVTITLVILIQAAVAPTAAAHEAAGSTLLATFTALALFEHWLLVLALPMSVIWPWANQIPAGARAGSAALVSAPPSTP